MATMDFSMVYLALAGSGKMDVHTNKDLNKHFSDKEKAALEYDADSSDKAIATVKVEGKVLTVSGKKAGSATITVKAYDGVNADPVMNSFDVMVVASNAAPTIEAALSDSGDGNDVGKLGGKLYVSRGASKITVTSIIYEGLVVGVEDAVTFSAEMGKAGDASDDIVSVSVVRGSKLNSWDVTLTPLRPGKQNVRMTIKDKFGAPASTEDLAKWNFEALVNTPPKLAIELPDEIILALRASTGNTISIATYFDTTEKAPTTGPLMTTDDPPEPENAPAGETVIDTTCTYATGPVQPEEAITGTLTNTGELTLVTTTARSYELTIVCQDDEAVVFDATKVMIR
jgi:hypothetical protein